MRTFCTWIATSLAATVFISGQGISATAGEQASAPTLEASQTSVSTREAEHASSARTVLNRYCVSCHNERMKANYADLALDSADLSKTGERHEVWEKVGRKLRAGLMPPAGRPRPDAPVQDRLVGWLETELDRAAVAAPNPGRTEPFHRLNGAEYRNVVRDLLALDIDAASLLPTDDASYGFDNIAGVLKINQSQMEQYLAAARKVSRTALARPVPRPTVQEFRVPETLPQYEHVAGLPLGTRGGMLVRYVFPRSGEYEIAIELLCRIQGECDGSVVFTPFLIAVRAGQIEAAGALLDAGANVNETTPDGTSALVLAIHNARYDMAAFLLERRADPNLAGQGWTALHQLLRTRSLNIGFFPHPEATGRTSGIELARKLIEHGADVNARITRPIADGYRNFWVQNDATPLLMAAKGADAEMMRLLAAHGANPALTNKMGTTPLMAASGVEMFNPNEDSGTNEEALEAVKVALELGADVNQANSAGDTPLHGAAWRAANGIIQLLVDRGARLDAKNKSGMTPLQIANGEEEGRVANINIRPWAVDLLVKLMKERGVPIEMKSAEGRFAFEKQKPTERRGGRSPDDAPDGDPPDQPSKR